MSSRDTISLLRLICEHYAAALRKIRDGSVPASTEWRIANEALTTSPKMEKPDA